MIAYLLIEITPRGHEDVQFKKIKERNILLLFVLRNKREAIIQFRISCTNHCDSLRHPAFSFRSAPCNSVFVAGFWREKRGPGMLRKFITEIDINNRVQ